MLSRNFSIYFLLTERCNLSCFHCIRNRTESCSLDMPIENGLKALEKLSTAFKESILVLSGGEPTLNSYFPDFMRNSTRIFPRVTLTTNGTFNDDMSVEICKYK